MKVWNQAGIWIWSAERRLAMKKMAVSNVLIVGVQGLGVEIGNAAGSRYCGRTNAIRIAAKDIVLAGVKSVTIYDPEPVTIQDLSTQVRGATPMAVELCLCAFSVLSTTRRRREASCRSHGS